MFSHAQPRNDDDDGILGRASGKESEFSFSRFTMGTVEVREDPWEI